MDPYIGVLISCGGIQLDTIKLTFESRLAASAEELWSWSTSVAGIAAEMRPFLKMSAPKDKSSLLDFAVDIGQPLFRSWILLFGILPIDRSNLTLLEIEQGHRFVEQSPMLTMRLWRHERIITRDAQYAIITDQLEFIPRFAAGLAQRFVYLFFTHRHSVLKRVFNIYNKSCV
jgi:ligand-binding SRPBCC domain-containing protein